MKGYMNLVLGGAKGIKYIHLIENKEQVVVVFIYLIMIIEHSGSGTEVL